MILVQFGAYVFPTAGEVEDVPGAPSPGLLTDLAAGGAWDSLGGGKAPGRRRTLSKNFVIVGTTPALLATAVDLYLANLGKRDQLWARTYVGGDLRWQWARCVATQLHREPQHFLHQPAAMTFEVAEPGWNGEQHGVGWYLDDGKLLNDGLYLDDRNETILAAAGTASWSNDGNRVVKPTITLLNNSSATPAVSFTDIRIGISGFSEFLWAGELDEGETLVIDCATPAIKLNGSNAYADLSFTANHHIGDWLRLAAGANVVDISWSEVAGAGAGTRELRASARYWDGWE